MKRGTILSFNERKELNALILLDKRHAVAFAVDALLLDPERFAAGTML